MESGQPMEFAGLQNTKEGGIVWRLRTASAQEKAPAQPPAHASLFEMMKDHERRVLEAAPSDPLGTKADDTWTKKLRKVAKTLIKIKNEKPSSFNEEIGVSKEEYRTFFSKEPKFDSVSPGFLEKISAYVTHELKHLTRPEFVALYKKLMEGATPGPYYCIGGRLKDVPLSMNSVNTFEYNFVDFSKYLTSGNPNKLKSPEKMEMRQTRSASKGSTVLPAKSSSAGSLQFEKEFDEVRIGGNTNRNHLYSKLVLKVKLKIGKAEIDEKSWSDLQADFKGLIRDEELHLVDKLTLVIGDFNFRGFMKNYLKDLLNHYRIQLLDVRTAHYLKGQILEQVLAQIEVFCKVYSNLELILSFDPETLANSVVKYLGRSECLINIFLLGESVEWDLLENNNPEEFALIYAQDMNGSAADFVALEQTIRLQIQTYLYHRYLIVAKTLTLFEERLSSAGPFDLIEEVSSICDLFTEDVPFYPEVDHSKLVQKLESQEILDLLQSNQAAYSKAIADDIEEKVMTSIPMDYAEIRKSYHKITQSQMQEHGIIHKQVLDSYGLPFPF